MPITLTVVAEIKTPRIPNFLHMADGHSLPIEAITDEGLREIGEAWTEALIAEAQKRRATPQEDGA